MEMSESFAFGVTDPSAVGEVRRRASSLAARLGFDETDVGRVALVITESASNLVKHAGGGEIVVRTRVNSDGAEVEILTLDRGPGIADLEAAFRDGYSAAGSAGTGLGAIRRVSSEFDVYSGRDAGTALLAAVGPPSRARGSKSTRLRVSGVSVALRGEQVCGDDWDYRETPDGHPVILVVDGLGHGLGAAEAAREALHLFRQDPLVGPADMLDRLHRGLRSTRGAAAAVAWIASDRGQVVYAGVGNIGGLVIGGEQPHFLVSHNGILGHEVRRIQEFTYAWPAGSTLVLHSDGLKSHWDLAAYPGLLRHHPALIAGILYRDFRRGHDDATVVVARPWTT
jgi:anti-sigma regulatory factor (Ser/Thr protein kinase)